MQVHEASSIPSVIFTTLLIHHFLQREMQRHVFGNSDKETVLGPLM